MGFGITSVVATLFLPLGFFTGLFGVNLAGMPGQEGNSFSFFGILLGLLFLLELLLLIGLTKKNNR